MRIALCYENVFPQRGGCETYLVDLTRRLVRDGHTVHLWAADWDAAALPSAVQTHRLRVSGPRFLRPWRFGAACLAALRTVPHEVSMGFDKTWGQDVLYPQGGLHVASADYNLRKFASPWVRWGARWAKRFDLAAWSFRALERQQYLRAPQPLVVVNSALVRSHFAHYYGIPARGCRIVHSAIDPQRFAAPDRLKQRAEWRAQHGLNASVPVAFFLATNYRLKGLAPLLRALPFLPAERPWQVVVAGSNQTAYYERLAARLGVAERVRFVGFCADAPSAYFGSDWLVHPTFYDPCSLVVLEALACGLPVVTTQYNGASELLRPTTAGTVVRDPHNARELAAAMASYLDGPYRQRAAHAARQAAAAWTFDDHYHALVAVLAEAAQRRAAA
jgi:UDP-glucose:(heptosyl)LPS alpha-1,3-glucosyltransferase